MQLKSEIPYLIKSGESAVLILGQWTFLSFFTDTNSGTQFALKYYIEPGSNSVNKIYQTRVVSPYQLNPTTGAIVWGKDDWHDLCGCVLQHIRLYRDFLADSEDKIINLALMNSEGIFRRKSLRLIPMLSGIIYRFYFASDYRVNNNQTFIVSKLTNISETMTVGFKGIYLIYMLLNDLIFHHFID